MENNTCYNIVQKQTRFETTETFRDTAAACRAKPIRLVLQRKMAVDTVEYEYGINLAEI